MHQTLVIETHYIIPSQWDRKAGHHWFCGVRLEGTSSCLLFFPWINRGPEAKVICTRAHNFCITRKCSKLGHIAMGEQETHYEKSSRLSYFEVTRVGFWNGQDTLLLECVFPFKFEEQNEGFIAMDLIYFLTFNQIQFFLFFSSFPVFILFSSPLWECHMILSQIWLQPLLIFWMLSFLTYQ